MEMIVFYVIIVIAFAVIKGSKKSVNQGNGKTSNSQKNTYERPKPTVKTSYNRTQTTGSAQNTRKSTGATVRHTARGDYDATSLDYCESKLSPSRGISFHGLKPGTDELALLSARNAARERELEKSLHGEHTH